MNNVTIVGRLTKDPELRYTTAGTPVATFTVAVNRDYKDSNGNYPVDFIPVEIMGKPAEFTANYIKKGNLVSLIGAIRVERYTTNEGENRTFTKVSAHKINGLQGKGDNNNTSNADNTQYGFSAVNDDNVPF